MEEISKAKKGYVKCMDKYRKACADAEAALKARDSAISNLSLGGSLGNAVTADHVTKMTTKCRDALKEYDSCETVVVAAINKFNVLRERYTNDINYIHTSELASMEDARTLPLQEYFEKCAIASNLIVNKSCEVVKSSLESLVGLDTNSELTPLHAALKCLDDFTASVDLDPVEVTGGGVLGAPDGEEGGVGSTNILEESCMEEEESETSAQKLLNNEVHSVGMQINTNMEYLDLFKTVSVRILQLLSDIRNDIEKTYVRASYKLMEKHGYSDMVSPVSLPYCTINNSSVLLPVTDVSAVSDKESNALCASQTVPTARVSAPDSSSFGNCWNSIVSYNVAMLDAYANFVHLLNTTVLPKHEAIVRKVDASKKDAFEKQSFHLKRIEAARNTSKKAWMKLTKIRRELKERRAAVKSSQAAENSNDKVLDTGRDSLTSLSAPPVSDVTLSPEQKLCASRVQELEEETEENVNDISTDSVSNVTSQLAPTAKVGRRGSVFDKFVRGTQKLGAVVGLATAETHAARIQRIQLQITDMEHEEVLCKAQWDSANEQLNEACTSYISTLTDCLEKLNNDMQADIDYFKSSSQSIFDTYTCIYKETVGSLSQQIKASADAIDREKDYASMVSCINGRGDNAYSAASDPSMDTTSDDCSIMNDIIHQEKHLGESGSKMLRTMGISAQQTVGGVLSSASSRGNKWTLMEEIELLEPIAAFQRVTCDLIEREKCSQKATIVDVSGNVSKLNLHSEIGNHAISKPGDVGATKDIPVSAEAGATNANDFGGDVDSENHSTEPRPARRRSRRRSHSFDAKQMQTMLNSSPIGSDADGRLISNDSAKVDSGVSDSRNRPRLFSGDKGGAEVPKSTGVSVGSSASVSNGGGTNSGGIMKELVKFGLSASDRIIESHACAYYPKRGLLSQGRMYITQHFAAFSSWDGTRILIPLYYVQSIEKMNSLFILSNALLIKTYSFDVQRTTSSAVGNAEAGESDEAELEQSLVNVNGEEEYSFGSFIDRDQCFTLLTRLQEIEKRLFSINQEEMKELLLRGNLVFGNQSAKDKENQDNGDHPESGDTSLSNVNCGDGAEGDASAVELAPKPQQRRQSTAAALALKFTKKLANATKKKETVPQPLATVVPFAAEKISDAEFPASEAEQEVGVDMTNYVDDGKVFSTLWKSANIGSLVEDVLPGSVQKVFRTLWLKTAGYGCVCRCACVC